MKHVNIKKDIILRCVATTIAIMPKSIDLYSY